MRRSLMLQLGVVLFAALFAPATLSPAAYADQYVLNNDHCTGGCGSPPFGTVDVTQVGANDVLVSVTLTSGDKFVHTGFDGSFAFNLGGNPTVSVSSITSGFSLVSTTAGAHQFDGFGNFEYVIDCTVCGNGASNPQSGPLSFHVTATGLTVASFAELSGVPPGDTRAFFVADILGTTGNTGPVGSTGPPTPVPEPGTFVLLGSGLVSLGAWTQRRLRRRPHVDR
jgi:hypothetical protein